MAKYSWLQNETHFIRYIEKSIRLSDEEIDAAELLPEDFYIQYIYKTGLAERFTWDLRSNKRLVTEKNVMSWLKEHSKINGVKLPKISNVIFTEEFTEFITPLKDISGIYSFWSAYDEALYLGKSVDLQTRIVSSFLERMNNYGKPVYLKIISAQRGDIGFLEMYLISKMKPILNTEGKAIDNPSVEIQIPDFSRKVLVCENAT